MKLVFRSSSAVYLHLLLSAALNLAEGGKLLVVPADGSHWLSMRPVVEKLAQNGANHIVVLMSESSLRMSVSENITLKTYPGHVTKDEFRQHLQFWGHLSFKKQSFLELFYSTLKHVTYMLHSMCKSLIENKEIIQYVEEETFDAVLTDPISFCGVILAEHIGVPLVNFLRGLPCNYDYISAQAVVPLSYVPRLFTKFSDQMSFYQRFENLLTELSGICYCKYMYLPMERLASEFLQKDVTAVQLFSRTSIWLFRYDFVFDYPRPIMANMVFIGGINCALQKSLTQDFEKLVNSSGEHGFVVFSLGSMVSEIPMDKAMDIAKALGSIPQKVIWRYTGQVPSNLADNTHLVKWLPQNDLLAHPKARAFITHAGSHGIYESICNAVPTVMLPLFSDQMDNAVRIESRGAGVTLNVLDMTSEDLSNALKTVIQDPSYKKNMKYLSALHLDRPIHPLDLAVYWVEFVMRHKGAPHLRPAAHELNFFQYHSLDVIAFLLLVIITTLFISLKCCCFVVRRCCGKKPRPQSKSKPE